MYYYHFCRNDFKTLYTNEDIKIGETLYYSGELRGGQQGFYASSRIIDALSYAPGTILCIVELGNPILQLQDKTASNSIKFIATRNIMRELINFCNWCSLRPDMRAAHAAYVAAYAAVYAEASAAYVVANAAVYPAVYAAGYAAAYAAYAAYAVYDAYDAQDGYRAERNLQEEWLQKAIVLWDYERKTQ